jgi:hypothetical protein
VLLGAAACRSGFRRSPRRPPPSSAPMRLMTLAFVGAFGASTF